MELEEIKNVLLKQIQVKSNVIPEHVVENREGFAFTFNFNTPQEIYNFLNSFELLEIAYSESAYLPRLSPVLNLKKDFDVITKNFKLAMKITKTLDKFPVNFIAFTKISGITVDLTCRLNNFSFPLKVIDSECGNFVEDLRAPTQYKNEAVCRSSYCRVFIDLYYLYQNLDILLRDDLFQQS